MTPLPPAASMVIRGFMRPGCVCGLLVLAACVPSGGSGDAPATDPAPATAPAIRSFAPTHGTVFTRVDLAGSGFQGATKVTFGGVEASVFAIPSGGLLYAAVPSGAGTGPIEVTTPLGVVASPGSFEVDPGPPTLQVASILPATGPVGTPVTLRGAGLFAVTSVTFGGVPATLAPPLDDSERVVTVPPGARTGPITVTLPDGTSVSSPRVFWVHGSALPPPVLKAFDPKSGPAGTSLEVDGAHLATVWSVTIGGREASFRIWSDARMTVWVPVQAPTSGRLQVVSVGGEATHPATFTRVQLKPVIHAMFPLAGRPGTEVTLLGDHLQEASAVRFGPRRATSLHIRSDTEVSVRVPEDAATGLVTLEVPHGSATARSFTVTDTDPGLQVGIVGLYVTQATQRMDGSVPLVAGKDGLLRVFLLGDRPNRERPALRITLKDAHGQVLLAEEVTAAGPGLPLRVDEGDLDRSWNLTIPGHLMRPGLRVRAELLPSPGLTLPPEGLAYPRDGGSLPLNIVTVPPMAITIVPIRSGFGTPEVVSPTRSLASWADFFKRIYPVSDLDVELAAPYTTSVDLGAGERLTETGSDPYLRLRLELEALRLRGDGGNRRYWYGVYKALPLNTNAGLGDTPASPESNLNRTAVGWDDFGRRHGANYPEVLAHELGHLLNRRHAPCGNAGGPDYHYPYSGGVIGASGLDLHLQQGLDARRYTDVMGYCSPQWVSDFTYRGVLEWRLRQGAHRPSGRLASRPQKGLLIWGTTGPAGVKLEPAFETQGPSSLPPPGDYRLECLDRAGRVLFELPFAPTLAPDQPEEEGPSGSFVFAIPMTRHLEAELAALQVRKGGVVVGTLGAAAPAPGGHLKSVLSRDPVATVWGEGEVLVTWDPVAYPKIIVKDAATGQDLAMADGGTVTVATTAPELEVILSDGLRTFAQRLQVRP